jgi:hypothetical protein
VRGRCKMVDLREHDGRYYFRIGSGDNFATAVDALKASFRYQVRGWDPEAKEWSVPATEESEKKLAAIFLNAEEAFTALHSQLRLL